MSKQRAGVRRSAKRAAKPAQAEHYKKLTDTDQLRSEIVRHRGNLAKVAKSFGVSRTTVYARVRENESLQDALEESRETMLDNAESVLYSEVLRGNITALIFFLKTRGRQRGYVERYEVVDWRVEATREGYDADRLYSDMVAAARARMAREGGGGSLGAGEPGSEAGGNK